MCRYVLCDGGYYVDMYVEWSGVWTKKREVAIPY